MQESVFPRKMRILSGSALKALAIFAMLVDHSAICFQPLLGGKLFTAFGIRFTPYILLRGFGRIGFPIFCFLLAEGFRHTRSKQRYALNLLVFAILSEIPYDLFNSGSLQNAKQNVFFTLLLGFLGILMLSRFREMPLRSTLAVIALCCCANLLKADYGWHGYLLILLLYALCEHPVLQLFAGITLLGWPAGVALAFPPLNLYNGQRGFVKGSFAKYFFYVFYPVHLCILWLLHLHFFGY